jgi:hypothetical protein
MRPGTEWCSICANTDVLKISENLAKLAKLGMSAVWGEDATTAFESNGAEKRPTATQEIMRNMARNLMDGECDEKCVGDVLWIVRL